MRKLSKNARGLSSWASPRKWSERILTHDPSWFLVCMGTGICVQILTSNFPYPAGWLRTIGYIFWILDICLFGFFTAMSLARALIFPKVAFAVLSDIQQTCYLGAIPTAWETIGTGLVIFYPNNQSAVIVAEVFFWIAVAMTLLVSCGGMYALYKWQGQHKLSEVTGAWLLIFIPMIVAATYGSNLASTVSLKPGSAILVVSFLMLSLGVGLSFLVLGIYLWRLMACQLPPRDAIVSTLVPVGPPGMAAYATVNLAVALSRYIEHDEFSFRQGWESALTPAARTAVSESIIWIGASTTVKMPFTKLVKNSAYYSRYQTKYKRRREGKTDYYARKRLITQAKNKYNAPKYRLVVRFTNRDIITQIVSSEISGDKVLAAAYSHELKRYGITQGLTNWAAAYATGLLLARRTLTKLGLDKDFAGVEEADGEFTLTEAAETDDGTRRPFKAFLDVGLTRTSTGARVFGAMKGASDGGIFVPHSENRFPGYDIESEELDAETLRKYIFGGHVAEYMETLADDDEERFRSQFHKYTEEEIDAGDLEDLYTEAHKAIREDPFKKDEDEGEKKSKEEWKAESKKYQTKKLSREERKRRVEEKIKELAA